METNKIYNESCLDTLKKMDDAIIDLTVTSPPYNIDVDYNGYNDKLPFADYTEFCRNFFSLLFDKTKSGGRLCLNIPNIMFDYDNNLTMSGLSFFNAIAEDCGWIYRENITWIKMKDEAGEIFAGGKTAWGSWLSASNPQFRSFTEHILVYHKEVPKKEPVGESDITKDEFLKWTKNTWFIMPDKDENHPAIFPMEIPVRCIKIFSYIGDLVYEPFLGSGTTIEACRILKRNFIGSEISKRYYDNYTNGNLAQTFLF